MAATAPRSSPYVYVTWIAKILSGDAQCAWAPWFKAHFTFDKVKRSFDSAAWSASHNDMIRKRVAALTADGWLCFLEDQNAFNLQGEIATLAGKPDIVAVRGTNPPVALVVDCKTGQRRDSDYQQVLVYMMVLPLTCEAVKGLQLSGEVQYQDGSLEIRSEELTPAVKERIVDAIRAAGAINPPSRTPSFRECGFCEITKEDCPQRIEKKKAPVAAGMF